MHLSAEDTGFDPGTQGPQRGDQGRHERFGDWADLYGGYGRPLTGDRWYENTVRVEFRLLF